MNSRRIITMQRQLRELGRIRSGYSEPYIDPKDGREKRRAVRSKTFILTARTRDNLDIAAQLWGGTVERWQPMGSGPEAWRIVTDAAAIDAILPPGDPLNQTYEFWNKGGAVRRCNGEVDEKSNGPCVCRRQFGDTWFERAKTEVCQPYTRLNVFLELSDFGYWRIETKSFYAAGELAGTVDLIKARIGPEPAVPIRLRIDPRTKVEAGKTTPYPVIVIELRGVATTQILAGVAPVLSLDGAEFQQPAVEGGATRAAIGSAPEPPPDFYKLANDARDPDTIRALWTQANQAGVLDERLAEHLTARAADLGPDDGAQSSHPDIDSEPDREHWTRQINAATTVAQLREVWGSMKDAGVNDKDLNLLWWARKKAIGAQEEPEPPVEAEVEPNREGVWSSILRLAAEQGWNTSTTSARFREAMGKDPVDADGWTMAQFLEALKSGGVQ